MQPLPPAANATDTGIAVGLVGRRMVNGPGEGVS